MNQETKRARIKLLLDDEEAAYVNVLANRLAKRHIEVTKALSGTEGIQAFEERILTWRSWISRWRTWTVSKC